jgi:transcription elongation factor Elf1
MSQRKALFSVADVWVTIACPHCNDLQQSPAGYGIWDKAEVTTTGIGGIIQCRSCSNSFGLPSQLFNLLAGVSTQEGGDK